MKKFFRGFFTVLICVLLLAGCGAEESAEYLRTEQDVIPLEELDVEDVSDQEEGMEEDIAVQETQDPAAVPMTDEEKPVVIEEEEAFTEAEEAETAEVQEEGSTYTYQELNQVMYASQSVNVRSLPGKEGEKLGGLTNGEQVTVTGQCNETGWYQVEYKGQKAFVSNQYLTAEQPVVQKTKTSTQSAEQTTPQEAPAADTGSANLVWIPTKGGKKYHSHSSCSGMKEPQQVTEETAIARGFSACKKCY